MISFKRITYTCWPDRTKTDSYWIIRMRWPLTKLFGFPAKHHGYVGAIPALWYWWFCDRWFGTSKTKAPHERLNLGLKNGKRSDKN